MSLDGSMAILIQSLQLERNRMIQSKCFPDLNHSVPVCDDNNDNNFHDSVFVLTLFLQTMILLGSR